ncbi:MAG: long-chain fatty acid--CoA ligase [Chloroflexota bacterium]
MTVVSGEPLAVAAADRSRSVVELIWRTVERTPDKEAIRWKAGGGWPSWTYAELWAQVASASIGLRRMGIGAGDRVMILSRSRPEWLVADLACMALGAVTCPLYPGDPPARMAEIARRVGPRLVFAEDAKLLGRLRSAPSGSEPDARIVLFEPEPAGGAAMTLADLVQDADSSPEARADWERIWRTIHPAQVATIVHTIGVDGDPLGVVASHANLLHSFHATVEAIPITSADVMLSVLPMSHMFERGGAMLAGLGAGATIAFAERQIERWAADMGEVRPTMMASIPLFFERIEHRIKTGVATGPAYRRALFDWATGLGRQHYRNHLAGLTDGPWLRLRRWLAQRTVLAQVRGAFGGRLRFFISGGSALPEPTGVFFDSMGFPILEGYGLTETAPTLTVNRLATYRYGTVGPPLPGTEMRIDPGSGEILVRGPQVMLGYLDRPADTARVLDAEGWLRTGDIGEFDEAQRLRITGRLKNLLVLATGKNVAPAPIERALLESPYIAQAVLLGDDRDATGGLLVPDLAAIRVWSGVTGGDADGDADDGARLLARPEVAALLRQEVDRMTAEFATYERPRRIAVLPRPLSAAAGEVDAAGSPVRSVVMASFPEQVAELFDRPRTEPLRGRSAESPRSAASPEASPEPTATASG